MRLTLMLTWAALACTETTDPGDDPRQNDPGDGVVEVRPNTYYLGQTVETPDGPLNVLGLSETFDASLADLENVFDFNGDVYEHNGDFFIFVNAQVTKWTYDGEALIEGETLDLAQAGAPSGILRFGDADSGFGIDWENLSVVEFNPIDMTVTQVVDVSAASRKGWDLQLRRPIWRNDVLYLYVVWSRNGQSEFINNLAMGILDTITGDFSVIEDERCPTSAGFGGWVDEQNDLYAYGDTFVGATIFQGDPKQPCVLRIPDGSRTFDDFVFTPSALTPEYFPVALNYAGDGIALSTGINLAKALAAENPAAVFAENIHPTLAYNPVENTGQIVETIPPGGVAITPNAVVDGVTYFARTTATSVDEDVESVLLSFDPETLTAEEQFTFPGFLGVLGRLDGGE
ncbi:MAG: hypothetical protein AAGA48_18395 [Myxococcota bacterium]